MSDFNTETIDNPDNITGINTKDWNGLDVIPNSLCTQCGGTGTTTLLLHKIPFFKELIIASFVCQDCNHTNNEVTFGGEIQVTGIEYNLNVCYLSDLNRQVIKSDSCSIYIPELDFEIPPLTQKGEISTIEGFLTTAARVKNIYI